MIRILLVDDQTILCEMMQTWLEKEPDFQVVGSAHDGETAIAQVEALQPDIVLLDIQMPGMDGVAATQIICQRFAATKVIVLSGHDDDTYLTNALRAGAKGYLLKNTAAAELSSTIRSVHKGYSQVGPGLFERIIAKMSAEDESADEVTSSVWSESDVSPAELMLLLQGFDAQALTEVATRVIASSNAADLFNRLSLHLKRDLTNLSALYLAGVLAHRVQGNPLSAFQYLRLGFKAALKQGLPQSDLLLFYREAVVLKPEEAFSWLLQGNSPFHSPQGMSFLLMEALQTFGAESIPHQMVLALGRIGALQRFGERCVSLQQKVEHLQQGLQRLDKVLQTI